MIAISAALFKCIFDSNLTLLILERWRSLVDRHHCCNCGMFCEYVINLSCEHAQLCVYFCKLKTGVKCYYYELLFQCEIYDCCWWLKVQWYDLIYWAANGIVSWVVIINRCSECVKLGLLGLLSKKVWNRGNWSWRFKKDHFQDCLIEWMRWCCEFWWILLSWR